MSHALLQIAPRKSSTTILLARNALKRPYEKNNFNVLMVKRAARSSFMPNMYVFPGGAVDKSDSAIADAQTKSFFDRVHNVNPLQSDLIQAETVAERVAAIREIFEETGVLLAQSASATDLSDFASHINLGFLASQVNYSQDIPFHEHCRQTVHADGSTFLPTLSSLGLVPSINALRPHGRWITPSFEKKRFDTYFYLAPLTQTAEEITGVVAVAPAGGSLANEITRATWVSPLQALELSHHSKIALAPPTSYVLSQLCDTSLEELTELSHDTPFTPWLAQRVLEQSQDSVTQSVVKQTTNKDEATNAYLVNHDSFIALPGDHKHDLTRMLVAELVKREVTPVQSGRPLEQPILQHAYDDTNLATRIAQMPTQDIISTLESFKSSARLGRCMEVQQPNINSNCEFLKKYTHYHRIVAREGLHGWNVIVSNPSHLTSSVHSQSQAAKL